MSVVEVWVQLGDVVRFGQAEGWLGRRFANVLIHIHIHRWGGVCRAL